MSLLLKGSVTRIADLPDWPFSFEKIDNLDWRSGDYVVAEVLPRSSMTEQFELPSGRTCTPLTGDLLVGALARRAATLEATGSFQAVEADGFMHCLTAAGCMGLVTSSSQFSKAFLPLRYRGHVLRDGRSINMRDCVTETSDTPYALPTVLLVGTSMSAGKTYSGRVAVRQLKALGHTVVGAKLTGAGRWHDTLSFKDAGADFIFDFIDAGLPTTVVSPQEYRAAIGPLLSRIADTGATAAVIEAGASPLEPYNGGELVRMLGEHIAYTILAASDPYAVAGILGAWERGVDLVAGPASNTLAGVALVHELAGLPALNLMDDHTHDSLRQRLSQAVGARGHG
jgi:hypothetical protein